MAKWSAPDYKNFADTDPVAQANQFLQMALLAVGGGSGQQWKNNILDTVVSLVEIQSQVGPITQATPIMGIIRRVEETNSEVPRGLVFFEGLSGNNDSNDLEEIKTDPISGGRGKYIFEQAKKLVGHRVFLFKYMEPNHRKVSAGGVTPEAFKNLVGLIDLGAVRDGAAQQAAAPETTSSATPPAAPTEDQIKAAGQAASQDLRAYAATKGMSEDELRQIIVANELNTYAALADPARVTLAKQAIDTQAAAKAAAAGDGNNAPAEPVLAGAANDAPF